MTTLTPERAFRLMNDLIVHSEDPIEVATLNFLGEFPGDDVATLILTATLGDMTRAIQRLSPSFDIHGWLASAPGGAPLNLAQALNIFIDESVNPRRRNLDVLQYLESLSDKDLAELAMFSAWFLRRAAEPFDIFAAKFLNNDTDTAA